jgi:hypothetical protein
VSASLSDGLPASLLGFRAGRFVMGSQVPLVVFALALFFSVKAGAQTASTLPDYVPLLPQVKAKATPVDPQKG